MLNSKTPHELLLHYFPSYDTLRVFGFLVFSYSPPQNRSKFDPRGRASFFLGYPSGCKGYLLLDLLSRSIHTSRHVTFFETLFPLQNHSSYTSSTHSPSPIFLILLIIMIILLIFLLLLVLFHILSHLLFLLVLSLLINLLVLESPFHTFKIMFVLLLLIHLLIVLFLLILMYYLNVLAILL